MRCSTITGLALSVVLLVGLWAAPSALAEDKPQKGGVLRVALAGDPPSLDMHQETTFLVDIPFSTVYNTLIQFDPHGYPNIIGDLAKSWDISEDGLTYTFHLQEGVKFHDMEPVSGRELTAEDVVYSIERVKTDDPAFTYAGEYARVTGSRREMMILICPRVLRMFSAVSGMNR